MKTISNMEDVIDSRDVIERIEELEALRKPWVAGWNMPGYMPDSEPSSFETCAEACDYIAEQMRDHAEQEEGESAEALMSAAERWDTIADDETEHGETVGNLHYFVMKASCEFDDADDAAEYRTLKAFADEAEGYCEDWTYGASLIRETYFVEYCQELCADIGDIPKNIPDYIEIDWQATARNLKVDYTEVDFDGVTYLVR